MKNLFFLFIFIFFGGAVFAGKPELLSDHGNSKMISMEDGCTLPPPVLVSVVHNPNASVTITWAPVVSGIGYYVDVYDPQNMSTPLYSFETTNTSTTLVGALESHAVVKIRSICANREYSETALTVNIKFGDKGIIVELINNGYQAPVPANGWGVPSGSYTGNDLTVNIGLNKAYRFTVNIGSSGFITDEFYVYLTKVGENYRVSLCTKCPGFSIYNPLLGRAKPTLSNLPNYVCNPTEGDLYLRTCGNPQIANAYRIVQANPANTSNSVNLTFNVPFNATTLAATIETFEIPALYDCAGNIKFGNPKPTGGEGGGGVQGHSDNSPNTTEYTLTAAPNPFTDHLTVLLEATGSTDLQLVDMSGKVWRSQSTEQVAGDLAYIETTDMPVGIYLLRVQTSKGIVTKKVVKIAQ
jgi:Secretion system C-terminal sorting domain